MPETIIAAAIELDGVVHSVPRPGRHHNVIAIMRHEGIVPHRGVQGFVTDAGRFVERREAAQLALAAGQVKRGLAAPPELFSEDLW